MNRTTTPVEALLMALCDAQQMRVMFEERVMQLEKRVAELQDELRKHHGNPEGSGD